MNKTVYYLEHSVSGRRLKWYSSRTGARIAQSLRNRGLGFVECLERTVSEDRETCWYSTALESPVQGTWIIVEDTIDSVDLLD